MTTATPPAPTVTVDPATGTAEQRTSLAVGLMGLGNLVMTNQAVPIVNYGSVHLEYTFWVTGTVSEMVAEVDRIAAILGEPARQTSHGAMYETVRDFGLVKYRACALFSRATPEGPAA